MRKLLAVLSLLFAGIAFGEVLPNSTQLRSGSNNTTIASGVLTNSELGWLPANGTIWIGGTNGVAIQIGVQGAASTNTINAAVAPLATTNYVYPRLWLATNAWLQVHGDGTNLLWIVSTNATLNVSNVVTTAILP